MKQILSALMITTLLSGCVFSDSEKDSGIPTPHVWSRLTGAKEAPLVMSEEAQVEHEWWKHFHDPVLDQLIADALENNRSLAIAQQRVHEARAGRNFSRAQLFPVIDGTAGITRANQGYLSGDTPFTVSQAAVEASWEIDLFGGNQARARQAQAILESEEANRDAVRVALLAEVARNYFDLRNTEIQLAITEQNLDTQRRTLSLIKDQFEGALASDFDVQRTSAQVATTEAQLPELKATYDAVRNRLQVLTGKVPGSDDAIFFAQMPLQPLDEQVLVAAPAEVLRQRPDIRAAERVFAASVSGSEAAITDLFPKISLLALFGVQDAGGGSANPWALGANLVTPILHFGRIISNIDAADAREQQAFLNYQQTVLEGLEDMENALSRYRNEVARNTALRGAMESSAKANELSRQQFTEGYNSLLEVLIAERDLLAAQSAHAASEAQLRKNLVGIYAAAGGGWKIENE